MHFSQPQPKSLQPHHQKHKVKHVEIEHKKTYDELKNKEWIQTIGKEIDQFEQTIHQVDALFKEAAESENLVGLGSFKMAQEECKYAASKSEHLKHLESNFKNLLSEEEKMDQTAEPTKEHQTLLNTLSKAREILQFQFSITSRVLILIQVYIKLKNQYTDAQELQKHRDYILIKIGKIKTTEEKHVKKLQRHYNNIVIDDGAEMSDEPEEDSEEEEASHNVREEQIKLCDTLLSYLSRFEQKDEDHLLHHDLATLQYFDSIKVALPFHSKYINKTIELVQARKTFYENAPESEFSEPNVQKQQEVLKKEQKIDVENEKDFPKLS